MPSYRAISSTSGSDTDPPSDLEKGQGPSRSRRSSRRTTDVQKARDPRRSSRRVEYDEGKVPLRGRSRAPRDEFSTDEDESESPTTRGSGGRLYDSKYSEDDGDRGDDYGDRDRRGSRAGKGAISKPPPGSVSSSTIGWAVLGVAIILCLIFGGWYLIKTHFDSSAKDSPSTSSVPDTAASTSDDSAGSEPETMAPTTTSQSTTSSASSEAPISTSAPAATPSNAANGTASPANGTASNGVAASYNFQGPIVNGVAWGWLPDDGSGDGGKPESIGDIHKAMGIEKSCCQGYYAQAQSGKPFDGSQIIQKKKDILAAGGILQATVMPTGGWKGLTADDNSQAVAICKAMEEFTKEGMMVWLRFGHEVNYYQTDGTYQGDVNDFQAGWKEVAEACKANDKILMWYTPNWGDLDQYEKFFPKDASSVDLIGIDSYPEPGSGADKFIEIMKPFHDKYCSDKIHFAIGETGLKSSASMQDRLKWAQGVASAEAVKAMPYMIQASWFNYYKGYDFKIANSEGDSIVAKWLTSGSSAAGSTSNSTQSGGSSGGDTDISSAGSPTSSSSSSKETGTKKKDKDKDKEKDKEEDE